MKKIFKISILSFLMIFSFLVVKVSSAQEVATVTDKYNKAFLDKAGFSTSVETPDLIASIIKTALSFLGVIFIVLMVLSDYEKEENATVTVYPNTVHQIYGEDVFFWITTGKRR